MEKLKTLNLISVLNNIDDDGLRHVLSKTNKVKIYNILKDSICNNCDKLITNHFTCEICHTINCFMLDNVWCTKSICLNCVVDLYITNLKLGIGRCVYIQDKDLKFGTYINLTNYKEGPIPKKRALELIKKYSKR